jgi:hypothetical protein
MGRNPLAHPAGAANAVLAAAGYNFRRLLAWLAMLLRVWLATILVDLTRSTIRPRSPELRSSRETSY